MLPTDFASFCSNIPHRGGKKQARRALEHKQQESLKNLGFRPILTQALPVPRDSRLCVWKRGIKEQRVLKLQPC